MMEQKMNFEPMKSSTPTTSAAQDNGNKKFPPDNLQFSAVQYPWCPFPPPPSGWCMSSPFGVPGYYPSLAPPFAPRMEPMNTLWNNNFSRTAGNVQLSPFGTLTPTLKPDFLGTNFDDKRSGLTPSDTDSTISMVNEGTVGVKKEGTQEGERSDDEVIFLEEKLNFSKERISWNDPEYCAACFELLESWSACPKLSSFSEKKKHALRHASQKDSTDWKTELKRCFPNSSPAESSGWNHSEENHTEEDKQLLPLSETFTEPPSTKDPKNTENCQARVSGATVAEEGTHTEQVTDQDSELPRGGKPVFSGRGRKMHGDGLLLPYQMRLQEMALSRENRRAPMKCRKCGQKLRNCKYRHALENHVLTHFHAPLFECGICGAEGKRVTQHLALHGKGLETKHCSDYRPRYSKELLEVAEQCFGTETASESGHKEESHIEEDGEAMKIVPPGCEQFKEAPSTEIPENAESLHGDGQSDISVTTAEQNQTNTGSSEQSKYESSDVPTGTKPIRVNRNNIEPHGLQPYQNRVREILLSRQDRTAPMQCRKCEKSFGKLTPRYLDIHVLVHFNDPLFQCGICGTKGKRFAEHWSRRHRDVKIKKYSDYIPLYSKELLQMAEQCFGTGNVGRDSRKCFLTTTKLPAVLFARSKQFCHSAKQKNIDRVQCKKCSRMLCARSLRSLRSHVYSHSGQKLKTCRLCNFSAIADLDKHFAIKHSNESQCPETVTDHRYKFDSQLAQLFEECFADSDEREIRESSGNENAGNSKENADLSSEAVEMDLDPGIRGQNDLPKDADTQGDSTKVKNADFENISGSEPGRKRLKFK